MAFIALPAQWVNHVITNPWSPFNLQWSFTSMSEVFVMTTRTTVIFCSWEFLPVPHYLSFQTGYDCVVMLYCSFYFHKHIFSLQLDWRYRPFLTCLCICKVLSAKRKYIYIIIFCPLIAPNIVLCTKLEQNKCIRMMTVRFYLKKKNRSSHHSCGNMGIRFMDSASKAILFVLLCFRKMLWSEYSRAFSLQESPTSATIWEPLRAGWGYRMSTTPWCIVLLTCIPSLSPKTQPSSGRASWTWLLLFSLVA